MPIRTPSADKADDQVVIPLVEERLSVARREIETGRVRIDVVNDPHDVRLAEQLVRGEVEIERIAIDRRIEQVPPVRDEGDTIIVPIVEEVLVVEKRLILKEELHIRRITKVVDHDETVTVRRQRAVIERLPGSGRPVDHQAEE